ncbi:MAG: glycosyltransferase family 39 protein [Bacteroidetes bacterium]|nr:glycosyltransferase family 39 protein [Bacteroidota bacterium]
MLKYLAKYREEQPLRLVLASAILFRLLAVIFSKGYGMHDDHFLVIEAAQSWADNFDYNNWLPSKEVSAGPSGHSLFYTGLHYLLFKGMQSIGLYDPQLKMFVVRFIHAAFSMLVVLLGYKITEQYAGKKVAFRAGMMLALFWFMPMLSVRNLIEVVCVPFLMLGTWMLLKNEPTKKSSIYLWAGFIAGTAFSIRFQSTLFVGGLGMLLLIQRNWKGAFLFGVGAAFSICLLQELPTIFCGNVLLPSLANTCATISKMPTITIPRPGINIFCCLADYCFHPLVCFCFLDFLDPGKNTCFCFYRVLFSLPFIPTFQISKNDLFFQLFHL